MKKWVLSAGLAIMLMGLSTASYAAETVNKPDTVKPEQSESAKWVKNTPQYKGEPTVTITTESKSEEVKKPDSVQTPKVQVMVNLASRELMVYRGNDKIATYPVGVGKPDTMTPVGYFHVVEKEENPTWTDPDDLSNQVGPGADNPLGQRWIGIGGHYGIHGTNRPSSVGHYVSHGCIRMHEEDVEKVFPLVEVNAPVTIYYDRIVIYRDPDHTISYSIYPDGYHMQNVTIDDVKKALKGYGVDTFASYDSISDSILASDGTRHYVGKVYTILYHGESLPMRAIRKDGVTYLPAAALSHATRTALSWDSATNNLTTPYGTLKGTLKSGVNYVTEKEAGTLFHVKGSLGSDYIYRLTDIDSTEKSSAQSL